MLLSLLYTFKYRRLWWGSSRPNAALTASKILQGPGAVAGDLKETWSRSLFITEATQLPQASTSLQTYHLNSRSELRCCSGEGLCWTFCVMQLVHAVFKISPAANVYQIIGRCLEGCVTTPLKFDLSFDHADKPPGVTSGAGSTQPGLVSDVALRFCCSFGSARRLLKKTSAQYGVSDVYLALLWYHNHYGDNT